MKLSMLLSDFADQIGQKKTQTDVDPLSLGSRDRLLEVFEAQRRHHTMPVKGLELASWVRSIQSAEPAETNKPEDFRGKR